MSYKNITDDNIQSKNITDDNIQSKNITDDNIQSKNMNCKLNPPWASIIMSIFGIILLLCTALGAGIDTNVKIFGILMILLWTLTWSIILYLLWKDNFIKSTWWMLVIGTSVLTLFYYLIVVFNVDNSI
jgi:hypothetical protein